MGLNPPYMEMNGQKIASQEKLFCVLSYFQIDSH